MAKVLFVLTSHGFIEETSEDTGFYFGEAAQPWDAIACAGHTVEFASPKGGKAPRTREKPEDPSDRAFLENPAIQGVDNTIRLEDVESSDYDAVHLPGGHGTMWDFAENEKLAEVIVEVYERGGVISAICHGGAGLVNAVLKDGTHLVAGKRLTSFTNEEEKAVGKAEVVPYLLETALRERGADYVCKGNFEPHVVTDGRLVTGQNPVSSRLLGNAIVQALDLAARQAVSQ